MPAPRFTNDKQSIRAFLSESRAEIASHAFNLRENLNIRRQLSLSFKKHPISWFGGLASSGALLATLAFKPKKKVLVGAPAKSRVGTTLLKVASSALLPVLKKILQNKIDKALQKR